MNWSQGLFPQTFHTKLFDEQVAGTRPKHSNWFKFVGLAAKTKVGPRDWIVKQKWPAHTMGLVPATCCRDKSQGQVLGTSPLACANLNLA